jgi:4,5-DOPA dioxygenase extradiol
MKRKNFLKLLAVAPISAKAMDLPEFGQLTRHLPTQGKRMPVLFTSHGNPMDIVKTREQRAFWNTLYKLGRDLESKFDVKAAVVVSAHWCTRGTYVNNAQQQTQIYDYSGFPEEYYKVPYKANGAPEIAHEIRNIITNVKETSDWGLDHGAWPMLMHLFPKGNVPVFQMSIDYFAKPAYHYALAQQLQSLRDKGVLIIGSGALIHNLKLVGEKMMHGDSSKYGWEAEYDTWIKEQIDARNVRNIINYETSHKLGKLAAPTPDHFVPVLYSLALMDKKDDIKHFYEDPGNVPAFSERSFIIGQNLS